REKLIKFKEKIDYYRKIYEQMSLSDFAYFLASDSGYLYYLESLFMGGQKVQNLMAFIKRMKEYEEYSYSDLIGFLKHVERLLKSPSESLEPTQLLSESDNVVRIMSIHKSKGLEFPVVFLTDMERRFSLHESRDAFIVDKELGIGVKVADLELGSIYNTAFRRIIESKKYSEMKSEEMRLLYVATTRAIDSLYLVGKVKDAKKYINSIISTPIDIGIRNANNMLDWVSQVSLKDEIFKDSVKAYSEYDYFSNYFKSDETECYKLEINEYSSDMDTSLKANKIEYDADMRYEADFDKIFKFDYPNKKYIDLPYKKTVSEITAKNKQKTDDTFDFPEYFIRDEKDYLTDKLPDIMFSEKRMSSAELGSLIHFVFQNISYKRHDIKSIKEELNRMEYMELINNDEKEALNPSIFVNFFKSELGERAIRNIDSLRRETSFTMKYEDIFLDGQVDGYFIEDEEIVLFDFKSDRIISEAKYSEQLNLYKRALEKATGLNVKKMYIYWIRYDRISQID
ncbi:MAG: 3'-5' exonuclease, partial [Tissierellia bacterium]|nr:3'-5' exonuclease [Tissierellia bacterium]